MKYFPTNTLILAKACLPHLTLHFIQKKKVLTILNISNARINANGNLLNPKKHGVVFMRNIDQIDFETGNIEFIEFWLQDPFINKTSKSPAVNYILILEIFLKIF